MNICVPSIFAVLALNDDEICEALFSKASLNWWEDQDRRLDSISLVQQVPLSEDTGHIDKETSEKIIKFRFEFEE